jgi:hypothetical protein
MHQVLSVDFELLCHLCERLVLVFKAGALTFGVSQGATILLDLFLVGVLHLDALFLVFDKGSRQGVDFMDHRLLF